MSRAAKIVIFIIAALFALAFLYAVLITIYVSCMTYFSRGITRKKRCCITEVTLGTMPILQYGGADAHDQASTNKPPELEMQSINLSGDVSIEHRKDPRESLSLCTVCTANFIKGESIRVLSCEHRFHRDCIDHWLLEESGTCPLW